MNNLIKKFTSVLKTSNGKIIAVTFALLLPIIIIAVIILYFTNSSIGLFKYNNPYRLPNTPIPGSIDTIDIDGQTYQLNKDVFSVLFLGVDEKIAGMGRKIAIQADTIILVSINKKTGRIDLLPIPRDIMVPIMKFSMEGEYAVTENGPICIAHSFGVDRKMSGQLMLSAVSYLMYNVPISRFASVGVASISHITDYVGGVPVEMRGDFEQIAKATPGETIVLDGDLAQKYVQDRSLPMMDGTNLSRMVRQREFLLALFEVIKQKTTKNILFPLFLYGEILPYFASNLSVHEMAYCTNLSLKNNIEIVLHIMEGEVVENPNEVIYLPDNNFLKNYVTEVYYTPLR